MRSHAVLLVACVAGAPAFAENAPPAPDAGRYSLAPAESGFLRLDKETGAVSYCSVKDGLSQCRVSADERAALETELERLRRENSELKARLGEGRPGEGRIGEAPRPRAAGPSEEEFDRALTFTERFMRRMMRILREEAPPGQKS